MRLSTRIRKALTQLPYLGRSLSLVWYSARGWGVAWVLILFVQGLIPALVVRLTQPLIDTLVTVIDSGGDPEAIRSLLLLAVIMGGLLLLTQLLGSLSSWVRSVQVELLQDYVVNLTHRQSIHLDLSFYDSHDYYDHLHRARREAQYRSVSLVDNLGSLLQNGITLVGIVAVILPYGLWLPLALLVSTLPALGVVMYYNRREYDYRVRTTADRRRIRYYSLLLTARESAAEIRLFGLGGHFQNLYRELRRRLRDEYLTLIKKQSIAQLGAGFLALLITTGVMIFMIWRALQGIFTFGDLALFYQAFNYGQRMSRSLLTNAGQIFGNTLFLADLFEFLALTPQVVDPDNPLPAPLSVQQGISFHKVTFSYPGNEQTTLRDFNLVVPARQIVAIVGANGAGKSTLVKLLCRFYDPQSGDITLDGHNLKAFSLSSLRRSIAVLFQQPVPYQDTAATNISLGDLDGNLEQAEIERAARAAGADSIINGLPKRYESLLGKWFKGGNELSVGEWQRIALARAFLRQSPIIILDEPTSAMDPWAESDWLDRFRTLAKGRTAIVITHRFSTARYADIIHVMDAGRIVESGTHDELLALDGRYAESWIAQGRS